MTCQGLVKRVVITNVSCDDMAMKSFQWTSWTSGIWYLCVDAMMVRYHQIMVIVMYSYGGVTQKNELL